MENNYKGSLTNFNYDLIIIVHGCPQNAADLIPKNKHWTGWLERKLRENGLDAFAPDMPIPWEPDYRRWKRVLESYKITEKSLLIGHSCGGAFLVRWLLETEKKIKKLILVAPAKTSAKEERRKDFYNFDLPENSTVLADEIVIFVSNDSEPMLESFEIYKAALEPRVIKLENKKHFVPFQMGTNEFKELLEEVLKS